ncbi:MAG: carboxypeptidase regulatory-like domain-containing protein [Candidatus Kerfeldbacteria bacterium]
MAKKIFVAILLIFGLLFAPNIAEAATLFFSPSNSSYEIGDSFNVGLYVNSGGQSMNAAQATVSFPTNLLEVTNVSSSGIFTLWPVIPNYSNISGTITFAGGLPGGLAGGYNGTSGLVLTISFRTKSAGTANATMGGALVLSNEAATVGTDLLSGTGSGTYVIAEPGEEPPEPDLELPTTPTISSSSHPDQNSWYANPDTSFSWSTENDNVGYSFSFDDQAENIPDKIVDTTDSSTSFVGTGDGVWYFHIRAQNQDGWGPTSHFKVQIDTTPPNNFPITLLDGKRTTVTNPRISFETTDDTSGIHHYDLITDQGNPVGINIGDTTPFTLPELVIGSHSVTAIAYDNASNSTSASNSFIIIDPEAKPGVIIEEIDELAKPLAEKIVDTFNSIIPAPIRDFTEAIGDALKSLKNNEGIVEVVETVVTPVMATSAVIAATGIALVVATTSNIYNILYLFFRFGYFWLVPIMLGKKRRSWGTVFDSISGKPIPRAIIKIFTREFNKLKESQIADSQGRFGFIIDKGKYFVTASSPGYVFPSHVLKTDSVSQYDNVYRGDTLEIEGKEGGFFAMNIPLDPNMKAISPGRLKWLRFISYIGHILEKISIPLLIVGTLLSWGTLIIQPKTSNFVILSLYGVLLALRALINKRLGKSLGVVKDKDTEDPIEMAIIRIYNVETGMVVATKVTNSRGQFNALLPSGKYYLVIVKSGYSSFHSKTVSIGKYRGSIHFTAELNKKVKGEEETVVKHLNEKDVQIHLEDEEVVMDKDPNDDDKNDVNPPAEKKVTKKAVKKNNKKSDKAKKTKVRKDKNIPDLPSDLGNLSAPEDDK